METTCSINSFGLFFVFEQEGLDIEKKARNIQNESETNSIISVMSIYKVVEREKLGKVKIQ